MDGLHIDFQNPKKTPKIYLRRYKVKFGEIEVFYKFKISLFLANTGGLLTKQKKHNYSEEGIEDEPESGGAFAHIPQEWSW